MEENKRETPSEEAYREEEPTDFGYMDTLLKAYGESMAKRKEKQALSEEKRAFVASAERRVKEICASLAARASVAEIKELSLMAKESAEQCLTLIGEDEKIEDTARDYARYPASDLLSRCVLLTNRALNVLVRGENGNDRAIRLLFSQISALYAIAAIR